MFFLSPFFFSGTFLSRYHQRPLMLPSHMILEPTQSYIVDSFEESADTRPLVEAESTTVAQLSDPEHTQRHSSDFHDFFLGEGQTRGGSEGKNGWLNWRLAKPHSLSSGTRQPIHPTYLSGDKISGVVVLQAERPKITSIRIQAS